MGCGDQQVGRQCRKPNRLQLNLEVAVLRIESSDTLYSEVVKTWTLWCGASCLLLRGRSHRQRLAGELPESLSTTNPSLGVKVASIQPHDSRCSQPTSS
jgi:hypothetical protein